MHLLNVNTIPQNDKVMILEQLRSCDPQGGLVAQFSNVPYFRNNPQYCTVTSILSILLRLTSMKNQYHGKIYELVTHEVKHFNFSQIEKMPPQDALGFVEELMNELNSIGYSFYHIVNTHNFDTRKLDKSIVVLLASMFAHTANYYVLLKKKMNHILNENDAKNLSFAIKNAAYMLRCAETDNALRREDFGDDSLSNQSVQRLVNLTTPLLAIIDFNYPNQRMEDFFDVLNIVDKLYSTDLYVPTTDRVKLALQELFAAYGAKCHFIQRETRNVNLELIKSVLAHIAYNTSKDDQNRLYIEIAADDLARVLRLATKFIRDNRNASLRTVMLILTAVKKIILSTQNNFMTDSLKYSLNEFLRTVPTLYSFDADVYVGGEDYVNSILSDWIDINKLNGNVSDRDLVNACLRNLNKSMVIFDRKTDTSKSNMNSYRMLIGMKAALIIKCHDNNLITVNENNDLMALHLDSPNIFKLENIDGKVRFQLDFHGMHEICISSFIHIWWNKISLRYLDSQGKRPIIELIVGRGIGTQESNFVEAYDPILKTNIKMNPIKAATFRMINLMNLDFGSKPNAPAFAITYSLNESGRSVNEGSIILVEKPGEIAFVRERNAKIAARDYCSSIRSGSGSGSGSGNSAQLGQVNTPPLRGSYAEMYDRDRDRGRQLSRVSDDNNEKHRARDRSPMSSSTPNWRQN